MIFSGRSKTSTLRRVASREKKVHGGNGSDECVGCDGFIKDTTFCVIFLLKLMKLYYVL